jgi:hypothetical protein
MHHGIVYYPCGVRFDSLMGPGRECGGPNWASAIPSGARFFLFGRGEAKYIYCMRYSMHQTDA